MIARYTVYRLASPVQPWLPELAPPGLFDIGIERPVHLCMALLQLLNNLGEGQPVMFASLQNRLKIEEATSSKEDVTPGGCILPC